MHKRMKLLCLLVLVQCSIEIPTVTFNNGLKIPILGFGTYRIKPNDAIQSVKTAIDIGYRHIDCAASYKNEAAIGQAIQQKIADGTVKRDDLFITSKLRNIHNTPNEVENALRNTLQDLKLDYLDLYLIHWPMGFKINNLTRINSDDDYVDTWKAMEELQKKGLVKSIGISNFNKKQIGRILEEATIVPVTNQIECHPYLNQQKLIDFCKSKNITITGYSSFGAAKAPANQLNVPILLENPTITTIAEKLRKSPAQILLRYQIQRGVIVIPKSTHEVRIAENFQVFDFELSADDTTAINELDINGRITTFAETVNHKYYPFHEDY